MELMVEVVGMKCFKGIIDGKQMDSGAVYSLVKLDERFNKVEDTSVNIKGGHFIEEWKLSSSAPILRMQSLKPSIKNPVMCRMEVERVSNGRETTELVIDIVPVLPEPAKGQKVAVPA